MAFWAAVVVACLGSVSVTPASDPTLGKDWRLRRIEQRQTFAGDLPVRVVNPFGDVRLRSIDDGETLLIAVAQGFTEDTVTAFADLREDDGRIVAEVRFTNAEGIDVSPEQVGLRRVDLSLIVPGRGPLEVESGRGLVESKNLPVPLTIRSESGDVLVIARDAVDVDSTHGPVRVLYPPGVVPGPLAVTTLTGDVSVELPFGIDRTVTVETSGRITSDFTIIIKKVPGEPHKSGRIRLGEGGDAILLQSANGTVSILEQVRLVEPGSHRGQSRGER
jgi:hypothetical protein